MSLCFKCDYCNKEVSADINKLILPDEWGEANGKTLCSECFCDVSKDVVSENSLEMLQELLDLGFVELVGLTEDKKVRSYALTNMGKVLLENNLRADL